MNRASGRTNAKSKPRKTGGTAAKTTRTRKAAKGKKSAKASRSTKAAKAAAARTKRSARTTRTTRPTSIARSSRVDRPPRGNEIPARPHERPAQDLPSARQPFPLELLKRHNGVPIGAPAQDASHNRSRQAQKRPLEFGPNYRTARTPKLTRSRAIDRSFRRTPNRHEPRGAQDRGS